MYLLLNFQKEQLCVENHFQQLPLLTPHNIILGNHHIL